VGRAETPRGLTNRFGWTEWFPARGKWPSIRHYAVESLLEHTRQAERELSAMENQIRTLAKLRAAYQGQYKRRAGASQSPTDDSQCPPRPSEIVDEKDWTRIRHRIDRKGVKRVDHLLRTVLHLTLTMLVRYIHHRVTRKADFPSHCLGETCDRIALTPRGNERNPLRLWRRIPSRNRENKSVDEILREVLST